MFSRRSGTFQSTGVGDPQKARSIVTSKRACETEKPHLGDRHHSKRLDPRPGVIAPGLHNTRVHHETHARNSKRRLCNVRGENHLERKQRTVKSKSTPRTGGEVSAPLFGVLWVSGFKDRGSLVARNAVKPTGREAKSMDKERVRRSFAGAQHRSCVLLTEPRKRWPSCVHVSSSVRMMRQG
jgi:hypothetical protein